MGTFVVGGTAGDPAVSGSGVVRPLVTQTTDRWGNVLSLTDPRHAGWVTSYTYNQNNQLVLESRPDGTSQAVYYDALGRQVATRDGRGNVNSERLDAGGHVIAEQHADGGVVTHAYNALGEKVATTSAETNRPASGVERITRFAYDKLGLRNPDSRAQLSVLASRIFVICDAESVAPTSETRIGSNTAYIFR